MGKRVGLGVVAVLALAGLTSASAPVSAATVTPAPAVVASVIDPDVADRIVAETPKAAPDHMDSKWASCGLQMTIDYAAGPGVDPAEVRANLYYPIRYLQDLGYVAALGNQIDFAPNLPAPTKPGTVLLIAAKDRSQMTVLGKYPAYLAGTNYGVGWPALASASIEVDAGNVGLNSSTILHELGHVLGLGHKEGTVMRDKFSALGTDGFDAAETAAIDCR